MGNSQSVELHYWAGRGLMEVPRFLLAIAGKFPGDYVDGRYTTDTAKNPTAQEYSKIQDSLTMNLGRMPLLTVADESIGQSAAINFYLATELNLMGSSTIEAAQIIGLQEHLKELVAVFRGILPYGSEPTDEILDSFFEGGATDKTGPADMKKRSERKLPWWLARIEATLGNNGFAVGSRLSLGDVLLYNLFAETLRDEEAPEDMAQWRREPFTSLERVNKALADCPKIKASIAAVADNANVKKWLATRGKQFF